MSRMYNDIKHAINSGKVKEPFTADDFKKSKEGRHEIGFNLGLKAEGDMTLSGNVTGTVPQAHRLDGVNDTAERTVET